jgi:P27 family predicted phage terminase small subunit
MPSALRVVRGNPGRRRQTKTEPVVAPGIPDPPAFLSATALQEWQRVAPELAAAGLLTKLDRAGFSAYCATWACVVACEEDLKARGLTVSTTTRAGKPRAYPVPNPSLAILHRALAQLRAWIAEFGLSPASRSRIQVEKPAPESAIEAFKRKHQDP